MNKPTFQARRLSPIFASLLFAASLAGCGQKEPEKPATTAVSRIENNPNLSPEARQNMLNTMQMRQNAGRRRAQAMHRAQPTSP